MGYSSFGLGPCLAEGVLCFELCEQRPTPPMSNSLFRLAGIKRCIFSVFLLGFRTFYPLHVLQPLKIIRSGTGLALPRCLSRRNSETPPFSREGPSSFPLPSTELSRKKSCCLEASHHL